jgi:hypothetical protein
MQTRSTLVFLVGAAVGMAACSTDQPTRNESPAGHRHAAVSTLSPSQVAQALNDLRRLTAPWHNVEKAKAAGYKDLFGCVDERVVAGVSPSIARGMGFHVVNFGLLDDQAALLAPEFAVYDRDPNKGPARLMAFDYFIPASAKWPAPENGGNPPTLPELGMPFTWSPAHNGWMFHIWPWAENPDGMFDNFNPKVPLCDCELNPQTGACTPA